MTTKKNLQKNSPFQIRQVQDTNDLKRRFMTIGFYGIAGFLGFKFLLQPQLEKYLQRKAQNDVVFNENKQQASVLYNAMNPSGVSWMRSIDQTNEKMVYEAARRISNWNEVRTTYRNLYNRDLLADLQSELDTNEYKTFLTLLNSGSSTTNSSSGSGTPAKAFTKQGMLIVASANIRIRSTPDSSVSAYALNTNVLGVANTNEFLGWATGKQQVDNKGVKYLEAKIKFAEAVPSNVFAKVYAKQKSKIMTFWVGAGAIRQYSYYSELTTAGVLLYKGVKDSGLRINFK